MSEYEYRGEDHRRQMSREKPEAICLASRTERHVFNIMYDIVGQSNYALGQIVVCAACECLIKQDGGRWVKVDLPRRYLGLPALVIQEQDAIEDLL